MTEEEEFKDDLLVSQCGLLNQRRSQSINSAYSKMITVLSSIRLRGLLTSDLVNPQPDSKITRTKSSSGSYFVNIQSETQDLHDENNGANLSGRGALPLGLHRHKQMTRHRMTGKPIAALAL